MIIVVALLVLLANALPGTGMAIWDGGSIWNMGGFTGDHTTRRMVRRVPTGEVLPWKSPLKGNGAYGYDPIENVMWVLGGYEGPAQEEGPTDGILKIHLATGEVERVGTLPTTLVETVGVWDGSGLWVLGGYTGVYSRAVLRWDGENLEHIVDLPRGGDNTGAAWDPKRQAVYWAGGHSEGKRHRDVYEVKRDGSYRVIAQLPEGVDYPGVCLFDDQLFVFGGTNERGRRSDVYRINLVTHETEMVGSTLPVTGNIYGVICVNGVAYMMNAGFAAVLVPGSLVMWQGLTPGYTPCGGGLERLLRHGPPRYR